MSRPPLSRLRIVTNEHMATSTLSTEFPSVTITTSHVELVNSPLVDAEAWRNSTSFRAFDDLVERLRGDELVLRGDANVARTVCQILTRYQRFLDRRNDASAHPTFDVVVRAHRAIHEERRAFGNTDLSRALDTWQWILRLEPDANLVVQLVALFRPVERIEDGVKSRSLTLSRLGARHLFDEQVSQGAFEYERSGHVTGERTFNILRAAGFDEATARRVREMVSQEDRVATGPASVLGDAEGLSFLSLGSSTYLDCYGKEQTRRRIGVVLRRLSRIAREKLELVRFRPDVLEVLREAA
jgi:hypothetical protein